MNDEFIKLFNCMCRASWIGNTESLNSHLRMDCPVYKATFEKLKNKTSIIKSIRIKDTKKI